MHGAADEWWQLAYDLIEAHHEGSVDIRWLPSHTSEDASENKLKARRQYLEDGGSPEDFDYNARADTAAAWGAKAHNISESALTHLKDRRQLAALVQQHVIASTEAWFLTIGIKGADASENDEADHMAAYWGNDQPQEDLADADEAVFDPLLIAAQGEHDADFAIVSELPSPGAALGPSQEQAAAKPDNLQPRACGEVLSTVVFKKT